MILQYKNGYYRLFGHPVYRSTKCRHTLTQIHCRIDILTRNNFAILLRNFLNLWNEYFIQIIRLMKTFEIFSFFRFFILFSAPHIYTSYKRFHNCRFWIRSIYTIEFQFIYSTWINENRLTWIFPAQQIEGTCVIKLNWYESPCGFKSITEYIHSYFYYIFCLVVLLISQNIFQCHESGYWKHLIKTNQSTKCFKKEKKTKLCSWLSLSWDDELSVYAFLVHLSIFFNNFQCTKKRWGKESSCVRVSCFLTISLPFSLAFQSFLAPGFA